VADSARTVVLVELLANSPEARRAVLSWPLVRAGGGRIAVLERWSRCAGVEYEALERVAGMLLRHGVCRRDRTVDPAALRIIEHLAAATMRRRSKR